MPTVITRKSKQARMKLFYEKMKQHSLAYLCVAYNKTWTNVPTVPIETDTITESTNCHILGYQTYESLKFVQVIEHPTEDDKTNPNNIFYKDSYYKSVTNIDTAISQGYTRIILTFVLNRDEYFPVVNADGSAVMFNQLGLITEVDPGSLSDTYFISKENYDKLTTKGTLEIIDNRSIQSRAADQQEEILMLLTF